LEIYLIGLLLRRITAPWVRGEVILRKKQCMPSIYINNWIKEIQGKIDYWYNNYSPVNFYITPLLKQKKKWIPNTPIIDARILNHHLTSCCPSPPKSQISFNHFPEPYYGNPDDQILKSAVILFFNPGAPGNDQLLGNFKTVDTFNNKYIACGCNYFHLSSSGNFCDNTIKRFIKPKTKQLNSILSFVPNISNYEPLFMDLVPWHSDKFDGLDFGRFTEPATIEEIKKNVFIPAILNAINTSITHHANKVADNKIIVFCVGAKYSKEHILSSVGFNDITSTIQLINNPFPSFSPQTLPYTMLNSNGDISVDSKSKIKVWKSIGSNIIDNVEVDENTRVILNNKEIVVFNIWNMARSMDIPLNIGPTIENIIQQL
jgi:hypothetical protein